MSVDKNHSEQFERYLKGQMSPEEAHTFEREIMDDSFAQEALEGFEEHGGEALADLAKLKKQVSSSRKAPLPFMRVAAVVALLMLGSFTVYFFTNTIEGEQLAAEEEPSKEFFQSSPDPDTIKLPDAKELVAEDLVDVEDSQPKTFNQDGLKVADKDDEVAQLAMEEEPEELIVENMDAATITEIQETEVSEELAVADDTDAARSLQGKVAGVQASKSRLESFTDSADLDEVVITAQPLIAEKRAVASSTSAEAEKSAKRSKAEPAAALRSASANETVSGAVIDDSGEPLPGVNVVIKGTTTGVTTDVDGNFELPKTSSQTLVVSYIGFESQEIEVGNRSYVDVTLGGATELQEVVVVGYGKEENDQQTSYSPAKPLGGNRAYKKYLNENLNYPEAAKTNEIEGTVVLELTIDPSGKISDISIKKSLGYGCDQEAIRLVNEGPKWKATEQDGKNVEDKVKVRVRFKPDL
ncbi:TonB family protein [Ekhidna sp. To15]|uniref:energy transducer TonB n=1 Tax=Ekhidna sp. To15 TaxID=3395267 RepID=UPI003F520E33